MTNSNIIQCRLYTKNGKTAEKRVCKMDEGSSCPCWHWKTPNELLFSWGKPHLQFNPGERVWLRSKVFPPVFKVLQTIVHPYARKRTKLKKYWSTFPSLLQVLVGQVKLSMSLNHPNPRRHPSPSTRIDQTASWFISNAVPGLKGCDSSEDKQFESLTSRPGTASINSMISARTYSRFILDANQFVNFKLEN